MYVIGFVPIWNYIVLKPDYVCGWNTTCFVPIWNYIVLKLFNKLSFESPGFVPIWNYIVLKPQTENRNTRLLGGVIHMAI